MKLYSLAERKYLYLFTVTNFMVGFATGLFTPIFAIFIKKIGGSLLDIGWAYSILMGMTGILMPFCGRISDKFGIKKVYIIGSFLFSITLFFYMFVNQVYQVFILESIKGIANAILIPLWSIISVRLANGRKVGKEVGFMQGSYWAAQGVAGIIGASIAYFFSFEVLFFLVGTVHLLGSLLIIPLKIE